MQSYLSVLTQTSFNIHMKLMSKAMILSTQAILLLKYEGVTSRGQGWQGEMGRILCLNALQLPPIQVTVAEISIVAAVITTIKSMSQYSSRGSLCANTSHSFHYKQVKEIRTTCSQGTGPFTTLYPTAVQPEAHIWITVSNRCTAKGHAATLIRHDGKHGATSGHSLLW